MLQWAMYPIGIPSASTSDWDLFSGCPQPRITVWHLQRVILTSVASSLVLFSSVAFVKTSF